jgi:hypothetical protein
MRYRSRQFAAPLVLLFLACTASAQSSHDKKDKHDKQEKAVWNYDGGIFLETDGSLPNGVCFRVAGRVTSANFFDNLKRFDEENGTVYRRKTEAVTQFPDQVKLSFAVHDRSCSTGLQTVGTRTYLTREMMSTIQLSLYWKHGVDLQPVKKITEKNYSVETITPYATNLASELPERFMWEYEMVIPSADVPITDSLVLIFRTPDGRIAARVAARM